MACFHAVSRHTVHIRHPHVTAYFTDGTQSFVLSQGATLGELAGCIDELGPHHDGAPFAIQIKFAVPRHRPLSTTTFPSNATH